MSSPIDIHKTEIEGILGVQSKVFVDERGFFTQTYNQKTWSAEGFTATFVQDNLSLSLKGTLSGMHYQSEPPLNSFRAVPGYVRR